MNIVARNAAVIAVATVVSSIYYWSSLLFLGGDFGLIMNFLIVPAALGFLSGHLLRGALVLKLVALAIVPIAHVLVFGSDPAKPGLENVVALLEYVPMGLGCIGGHIVLRRKYLATTEAGEG